MRKRSETIVVSIAVLGTLICVCLGGCSDKKGDAFAEEERTTYIYGDSIQEGDDGALLSVRLGVPGACNVEFDTGKSKLRKYRRWLRGYLTSQLAYIAGMMATST